MKSFLKTKPPSTTPVDVIRRTHDILSFVECTPFTRESKHEEKMAELCKNLREIKVILYGDAGSDPASKACAQLTHEFFRENTFRLLINCLPKLNLEARKDATQVVANLQRQRVHSRLVACDYLEANFDLMDILIQGYENSSTALHYGAMLRECVRHQSVAKYVLESLHMRRFFYFIQLPNFDIAADAAATFKESSKSIQKEAFNSFKLFATNQNKPPDIVSILVANRSKLLRLLSELKLDKDDEQFELDKDQVMKEIKSLEPS